MTDAVANVMWQCVVFCDMSRMLARCHRIRCEPSDHMCDDDDVFTSRIFEVTMNRCDQGLPGGWHVMMCEVQTPRQGEGHIIVSASLTGFLASAAEYHYIRLSWQDDEKLFVPMQEP